MLKVVLLIATVALILSLAVYEHLSGYIHLWDLTHHDIAFPVHQEPLATDWGHTAPLGELIDQDGCLRLARHNRSDRSTLLVWPPGYSLYIAWTHVSVLSPSGRVAARVGDTVRVSGMPAPKTWADASDLDCPGPYFLVGDDVSVVEQDEPSVVELPGSTLYFPRGERYTGLERELMLHRGRVGLSGNCLLLDQTNPPRLVVWPPGFWPHIGEHGLEVRNSGGEVVARPGDVLTFGRATTPPNSPFLDREQCPSYELWYIRGTTNVTLEKGLRLP